MAQGVEWAFEIPIRIRYSLAERIRGLLFLSTVRGGRYGIRSAGRRPAAERRSVIGREVEFPPVHSVSSVDSAMPTGAQTGAISTASHEQY